GEPQAAKVLTDQGDGAAVVVGAMGQVSDDLVRARVRYELSALGPLAPVVAKNLLFFAILWPIARIGVGNRQPQRSLIVAEAPGLDNELVRHAEGAETLAVEVVGQAIGGKGGERFGGLSHFLRR